MSGVVLLGPQRLRPTIGEEVAAAGLPPGPVALITAGWQEREDEDQELAAVLPTEARNVRLYHRWEALAEADPEYFTLHRQRQDRLRKLQRLYRQRLRALLGAARRLLAQKGTLDLIEPEREHAVEMVRALDRHHLARVKIELADFEQRVRPWERDAIVRQRQEVAALVRDCSAVLIAGGHVAVLLNRLQLFDVAPLLRATPVFAWSAGAMTLCERVVLFHDHPPQGAGDAELMGPGLGLVPRLVVLPHARRRLRLADPLRVGLVAGRFAPAACVPLDEGDRLAWDGAALTGGEASRWMQADGSLRGGASP